MPLSLTLSASVSVSGTSTVSINGAAFATAAGVTGIAESAQFAELGAKTFGAGIELLCEDFQQIYWLRDLTSARILAYLKIIDMLHSL